MRRTSARTWGVLLVIAAFMAPPRLAFAQAGSPSGGAPSAAVVARADALFQEALKFHIAKQYAQAEPGFQAAFELNPTYDVAGNLGYVKYHLGKYREAADLLAFVLRNFPLTAKPNKREHAQKTLDEVRKFIATVTVRVSVAHAEVFVDGKPVGVSPLPYELFLDPGAHVVEAKFEGRDAAKKTIQADKGSMQTVELTLVASAGTPPRPPGGGPDPVPPPDPMHGQNGTVPPGQPPVAPPQRRSVVPGAVLGSVAGAALVTGIGLFASGRAKDSSLGGLHDAIVQGGHVCVAGAATYDSRCADLLSKASMANTFEKAGVGLMVGAGVAAIGTVIYFVVPPSGSTAATGGALRITPALSPSTGGLVCSGTF